jgi:hypothetical protein
MKSVAPDELIIHRAFFTEFDRYGDPTRWSTEKEMQAIRILLERHLKLLILTKAHVVIAGSHLLESPFAHAMLIQHPRLLESRTVIPSIKDEHPSAVEFLKYKREEYRDKQTSPYHSTMADEAASIIDSLGTNVRWTLSDNSGWFRDRLANDLDDDKSLIRLSLRREGIILPQSLTENIRAEQNLSRDTVARIVAATKIPQLIDILKNYADLVYYLSGARTVKSEGVLPQENLIDFSLSELAGGKTRLSEQEVFFKLFLDIVKTKTCTIFPADFLDAISIEDAIDLHNVAIAREFTEKYNIIQLKTKEALDIRDPEQLILLLGELDEFETELHYEFNLALDRELPTRVKEEKQRSAGRVLQAVASIFIPGYNPDAYKEVVVSGLRWMGRDAVARSIEERIQNGLAACGSALENTSLLERQVLLDFVDHMKKKYQEKMFGRE